MVADESHRDDDGVLRAAGGERAQGTLHVGLEPGLVRAPAPALEGNLPAGPSQALRDRAG